MHSFSSLRHKRRDPISNFSTIAIGQRSFDLVSPSSTEFYQFQWLGSMISGATRFDAIRRISIASSSGFIPRQSGALESEERWNTARSHSNAGRSRLFRCGPSLVPVGILRRGGGGGVLANVGDAALSKATTSTWKRPKRVRLVSAPIRRRLIGAIAIYRGHLSP